MSLDQARAPTTPSLSGTMLGATLWHPYLGIGLASLLSYFWPSLYGSARLAIPCLIASWLVIFLGYLGTRGQEWLAVDRILSDPSTSFGAKLRGVATNWVGITLLAMFAGYLVVVTWAGVHLLWR